MGNGEIVMTDDLITLWKGLRQGFHHYKNPSIFGAVNLTGIAILLGLRTYGFGATFWYRKSVHFHKVYRA